MDECFLEIDVPLEQAVADIRALLADRPEPPWLDLGDRIVWFPDDDARTRFLDEPAEERRRRFTFVPVLGWWNGALTMVAARDPLLDAAQQELLIALARDHHLRLLANGFHPTPLEDLTDPELYP